ncbi:M20/M25/M40 family peptidase [Alkalihalobacillus alcalophilus ATCC 27647 = CGMCC 1.3604]|uniref:M20/M25/M40 family peptidase n=1 Tax=Alkalihalobacillus alcalophilus ATCC 27647 = CGMCC 1.3604 TaxID=1218173 RepID=A0A094WMI3_ALKAL|nr:dipeptidase [Alkalihalobacillus alcalophilus]KGA97163.1 peptidase M20 [Alkalihalobacillus alcalophilus ATCC 27647 = CGMCC 1.3604]MED1560905.1 dipeptidase [Alkalihalobacillus alcalophilus]THG89598.1 M20/M25/M40 family peptidase [Alkalihalobacillus alcalophilus ATCC 27647 = CGMCC 1.3604]
MSEAVKTYLQQNRDKHLSELGDFLSIPSISALSEHKEDVRHAAEWMESSLKDAGVENVRLMETGGHPVVYGDWLHAAGKPTVLIYGHYDVQPVDPVELWETPPFEAHIRDEKIYARGASDDKGQTFMHVKAIEALLKVNGELPVNVKFLIEGEEEIGSVHLDSFVEEHRELLAADVLVISDTPMLEKGRPAICSGLRGLSSLQIDVKGAKGDLHSGLYGGGVQNSIHALVQILDSMRDSEGRVTVAGFYDKVEELNKDERAAMAELNFDEENLQKELEVPELFGEKGYSMIEQTWIRPTLEINGIYGGFQGEGVKTVIPSEAHAKITCRLVPTQDPDEIASLIEKHIAANTPKGVTVTTKRFDSGKPFAAPVDHPAFQIAAKAYEEVYSAPVAFTRMGGSIPVVETFDRILQVPIVLMGFGLPSENFHAPNEHFHLENFDKGLQTISTYLEKLGTQLNN